VAAILNVRVAGFCLTHARALEAMNFAGGKEPVANFARKKQ
jgi:hypothetical protein